MTDLCHGIDSIYRCCMHFVVHAGFNTVRLPFTFAQLKVGSLKIFSYLDMVTSLDAAYNSAPCYVGDVAEGSLSMLCALHFAGSWSKSDSEVLKLHQG